MLKNLDDPDDVVVPLVLDVPVVVLLVGTVLLPSRLLVDARVVDVDGDDRLVASLEIFCRLLGEDVGDEDATTPANGDDAFNKCCGG